MGIQWVDVSIPMGPGMPVWPGDPPFTMTPAQRVADGDTSNVSNLSLNTHCGTHIDAPWHYEEEGARLHEIDHALFFGEALVIDVGGAKHIGVKHLGKDPLPARVLFRTKNSRIPADSPFREDFVAVESDAARRLVDENVRLVGIDYLSIGPYSQEGRCTHHILLHNGIVVVEGLRLEQVGPGVCSFVVLPLALLEADGSPCRAFVGMEDGDGSVV